MLIFPITRPPVVGWNSSNEDNLIRSKVEDGYEITRPRYTKIRAILGPFTWQYLSENEYDTLMDFYNNITASGSLIFQFTVYTRHRTITKNVRFTECPESTYSGMGWLVKCTFREV